MGNRALFCRAMQAQIGDWNLLSQAAAWGLNLNEAQQAQLRRYLEHLYAVNQQMNLTRVPPEQAVGRHLLDSLCLLAVYSPPEGARVLDIGAGAGLPGIPLAIARPDLKVTLLDSHGKTVKFLQETCTLLGLDAEGVQARAEEWAHHPDAREQFDVVVARAVARMAPLTELMIPFLRVGGVGLALKSGGEREEVLQAVPAARALGATLEIQLVEFQTEQGAVQRIVAMLHKQAPTPSLYPRRWAQILKRPLGGKA